MFAPEKSWLHYLLAVTLGNLTSLGFSFHIYSFNIYFLSAFSVPDIVLGGGNLAVNNSEKIPGVYILVREKHSTIFMGLLKTWNTKQNCLAQCMILYQALTYQLLLHFTFFLIQFRFSDVLFSSFSLDIPIYHSLSPQGNRAGPAIDRDTSSPFTVCHRIIIIFYVCCVLKRTIKHCFHNPLPYCPPVVYPWWNTIQLNYLFYAHTWVLQKKCHRNPKICTSIRSRFFKSNDPSSLPQNVYFSSSISHFLQSVLQNFFLLLSKFWLLQNSIYIPVTERLTLRPKAHIINSLLLNFPTSPLFIVHHIILLLIRLSVSPLTYNP